MYAFFLFPCFHVRQVRSGLLPFIFFKKCFYTCNIIYACYIWLRDYTINSLPYKAEHLAKSRTYRKLGYLHTTIAASLGQKLGQTQINKKHTCRCRDHSKHNGPKGAVNKCMNLIRVHIKVLAPLIYCVLSNPHRHLYEHNLFLMCIYSSTMQEHIVTGTYCAK